MIPDHALRFTSSRFTLHVITLHVITLHIITLHASDCDRALRWDHGEQQADDLGEQAHTMVHDGVAEQGARLQILMTTFSGRTQAVLIEANAILPAAPTVTFSNMRADRSNCIVKLPG